MASRRERCSRCRAQLWVPPRAQTVRCGACHAITRVQPYGPGSQTHDSMNYAANTGSTYPANMVSGNISPAGTYAHGHNNYGYNDYYGQPSPPPPRPRPVFYLPSAHGRKRALLCGVSYRGTSYKIKGSINDVNCMRFFLAEKLGFPDDSIVTLTEDEENPLRIPTKENMRLAMRWLVQGCQAGDSLVFHFSGHGSTQQDYNKDEADETDEAICPLDFETEGKIIDDEINATLVRPLPWGATLHAIIDTCYSGTVFDLPFLCRINREGNYMWEGRCRRQPGAYKGTSGGLAICISACDDDQTCIDTTAMAGNASTGALTYSFIQAVEKEPGLTYGRLLNYMRQAIGAARTAGLRLNGRIPSPQDPQLSSSEKFDIYSEEFIL